jgi:hypothetical protein
MPILLTQPVCNQCGLQLNPEDLTCPTHKNTVYLLSDRRDTKIIDLPIYYRDHQAILTILFLFDFLAQQAKVDLIHGFRGSVINIIKTSEIEASQIAILETQGNDLIIKLPREQGVVISMAMNTSFVPIYNVTVVDQNGRTRWVNVGVHKLYQNPALRDALKAAISI